MSNCLPYAQRFFDELEMFEDVARGHSYKAYLWQSVKEFLENENQETAFAVYRAFFDSYRITLPGENSDRFVDIVDVLRNYEATAATLIDKQRDHFVHAVNVFITGLSIFAENAPYRDAFQRAVLDDPCYADAYSTRNEEFFYRWGLASLFHDVGYPVEIVGHQINRFIKMVADTDGDENPVRAVIHYENFDELNTIREILPKRSFTKAYYDAYESCSYIDLLKPLDLMANRIHQSLKTELDTTCKVLDRFSESMAASGFIDHGYYSALIVLKWYGYLIQQCGYKPVYLYWPVLDSATAILLHNYYKNVMQKPPFSLGPLRADQNPIAFLLILCDELQEWNREARGIVTRTFTLADTVHLSVTDSYLSATFVTKRGHLPDAFCEEKEALLKKLLYMDALFPSGVHMDNTSLETMTPMRKRLLPEGPRPLLENLELLAIAIHAQYNTTQLEQHPDAPLRYPNFSDLPDDLKYSNLRQARGIYEKLACMGYALRKKGEAGAIRALPHDVVEYLAEIEHEDWMRERIQNGWTLGPKDVAHKVSPYLVPYDELSEEIKDFDRNAVKNIPRLADLMGMAVYEA